jgi:hypothetical protein
MPDFINKKIVVAGGVVFAFAVSLFWLMNPVFNMEITKPVLAVSPDILREHVLALVSQPPYRSSENWQKMDSAANYIKSQWEKMGYQVEEQIYEVHGKRARNLIVSYVASGLSPDSPRVVVGAHYDVCMNLPGADDNASGVAGLLELGRLVMLKKPQLNHRLDFLAYALEEPPYYDTEWMGSLVHAKSMHEKNIKVDLMLSLEMIGYFNDQENSQNFPISLLKASYPTTGNFIALVGSNSEWIEVRNLKAAMQSMTKLPIFSMNTFALVPGIDWSDHRSYWSFGIPAVMVTDTSYLRNQNYHKSTDTPETLDYIRMAEVVKAAYGAVVSF